MTMDAMEAFRKSLWTWKSWATQKLDPERSNIFFRSYSPVHYRDGKWNGGGHCDLITEPETNDTKLEAEPLNNVFISEVVKQMEYENRNVQLLNITYLTGFRKDGHPANNREPGIGDSAFQDCSHWCLPGVPDTWNELLYARLILKIFFFLNFEGCTLSAQLILMLIHPRFLRCLVHWFPFPSFSQAASRDPTFLVHM